HNLTVYQVQTEYYGQNLQHNFTTEPTRLLHKIQIIIFFVCLEHYQCIISVKKMTIKCTSGCCGLSAFFVTLVVKLEEIGGNDGSDAENVCYLRDITCPAGADAVVVVGRYIGMEFAAALVANRMKVIVVFPGKHLMANLFTPKIAEFYENYYASKGVTFIKGTAVSSLQISSEKVTAAILRDGRRLPADMPRSTAPRSSSTGRPSSSSPTLTTPTSTVPRNRSSVPSGSRRTPIETHAKQCHFRLASCAAGGGLRTTAECVKIAIGYSDLLEARGLSLSSVLMKQFRPSVEQALDSNLRRIEESTAALAAADDWILTYPPTGIRPLARSSGNLALQPKLSSSAHRFNSMVQDFFGDVGPLVSLQLGGSAMDGLLKIFNSYVNDILDIGCSVGVSTRYLTEKFPSAQAV
ncbi:hypothetical protein ACJX0J_027046, partial [Zea mays]